MDTTTTNPAVPAAPSPVTAAPAAPASTAPASQTATPALNTPQVHPFSGKGRKNRQPKVQK